MECPRQERWSGLPLPTPGDLSDPGIEPRLLHLLQWQADPLPGATGKGRPRTRTVIKPFILICGKWSSAGDTKASKPGVPTGTTPQRSPSPSWLAPGRGRAGGMRSH